MDFLFPYISLYLLNDILMMDGYTMTGWKFITRALVDKPEMVKDQNDIRIFRIKFCYLSVYLLNLLLLVGLINIVDKIKHKSSIKIFGPLKYYLN